MYCNQWSRVPWSRIIHGLSAGKQGHCKKLYAEYKQVRNIGASRSQNLVPRPEDLLRSIMASRSVPKISKDAQTVVSQASVKAGSCNTRSSNPIVSSFLLPNNEYKKLSVSLRHRNSWSSCVECVLRASPCSSAACTVICGCASQIVALTQIRLDFRRTRMSEKPGPRDYEHFRELDAPYQALDFLSFHCWLFDSFSQE